MKSPIPHQVLAEWHPTKNDKLDPLMLSAGSNFKAWWQCLKGHEWEAVIAQRVSGSSCPFCSGRKAIPGETDLLTTNPISATFWDVEKNTIVITSIGAGSGKKAWWKCSNNHEWYDIIRQVVDRGDKACNKCSSFGAKYSDKATFWHPTSNLPLTPFDVTPQSKQEVIWLCDKGHEWNSQVAHQVNNPGCPVCKGRKLVQGISDLATVNPALAMEWDYENNDGLLPSEILPNSSKVVAWRCPEKDHRWQTSVVKRHVEGISCYYCSGYAVLSGESDLATLHPDIAAEWDVEVNLPLTPNAIAAKSGKKVGWKCIQGHKWQAVVNMRVSQKTGCPICSGKQALAGFNDLKTCSPEIASEWNYQKNGTVTPEDVTIQSRYMAWWKCTAKGHEWQTAVYQRTRPVTGTSCPRCWMSANNSKPELEIYEHLIALGLDVIQQDRKVLGSRKELDLYIPSKSIGIEFNGLYWHSEAAGKSKNYHYDKWLAAKQAGIQLIQVWEDDWASNKMLVLKMLEHKLGVSAERKIGARSTFVKEITKQMAEPFLNANHIQGYASGTYYLSLQDKESEEVVAVLVLKKESHHTLNIIRYATSIRVMGGFTKLMAFATSTYDAKSYITFADHTISDGKLYEDANFVVDAELPPDYMYIVNKVVRKHKFGYRLSRFKNDPVLKWDPTMTERELALLNGLTRIWDAGKTKYKYISDS